jgi:hypothetical protein
MAQTRMHPDLVRTDRWSLTAAWTRTGAAVNAVVNAVPHSLARIRLRWATGRRVR